MTTSDLPKFSDLDRFETDKIRTSPVIVNIGNLGMQYTMTKNIFRNHGHTGNGLIMIPESEKAAYSDIFPEFYTYNHDPFNTEILSNFCKTLSQSKDNIFLQEVSADHDWNKNRDLRYMFINSRALKTSVMLNMYYPFGMSPVLRSNIDYTFIFQEQDMSNRRILYDNYAGMFPSFENFCTVMDSVENRCCLVIDNTSHSTSLMEQVFWYDPK